MFLSEKISVNPLYNLREDVSAWSERRHDVVDLLNPGNQPSMKCQQSHVQFGSLFIHIHVRLR